MKKILPLLCISLLISACGQQISDAEKEFNESGRAKAIEHEEDMWQYYEDEDIELSFKYPNNVSLDDDEGTMLLSVNVEPIESLEGTMGYNKETALKNQKALENGDYGEGVDFPLEASKRVVSISDTHAQQFMVLGRFEVCDVTFERKLYFFHDDHQIVITLYGSKEDIVESSSEFFTTNPENCGKALIWNFEKQADFYSLLERDEGSESSQEWFDTFERIVNTIEFFVDLEDVRIQLQGRWVSTEDELSSIVFSGDVKKDFYDNEEMHSISYVLKEAMDGPQIVTGEGDGKETYAVMELSADELQLLHLPRGNTLKFKR